MGYAEGSRGEEWASAAAGVDHDMLFATSEDRMASGLTLCCLDLYHMHAFMQRFEVISEDCRLHGRSVQQRVFCMLDVCASLQPQTAQGGVFWTLPVILLRCIQEFSSASIVTHTHLIMLCAAPSPGMQGNQSYHPRLVMCDLQGSMGGVWAHHSAALRVISFGTDVHLPICAWYANHFYFSGKRDTTSSRSSPSTGQSITC